MTIVRRLALRFESIRSRLISMTPQKWFVVASIISGIAFIIITPPYQIPDEYGHMARSYQVSTGKLWADKTSLGTGAMIPSSLGEIGRLAKQDGSIPPISIKLDDRSTIFAQFPNLTTYSPLLYAPQAIGMTVGEWFGESATLIFYLGRLANLIIYTLIIYFAIRIMPFGKWALVTFTLLPMHVLLASSYSADPMTISVLSLFIATIFYFRSLKDKASTNKIILLLLVCVAVSMTKIPIPIVLIMTVIIPSKVIGGSPRMKMRILLAITAICAVICLGWISIAQTTMSPYGPVGVTVDPKSQLNFMISHPLDSAYYMVKSYTSNSSDAYSMQYVISIGPVAAWLPVWLTMAYTTFITFVLADIRSINDYVGRKQKLLVGTLLVIILLCTSSLMYISWNKVGATNVEGFQARYFSPLLLLCIPLFSRKISHSASKTPLFYMILTGLFLASGIIAASYYFVSVGMKVPF